MADFLKKLSSYNLFNYLLPGVIFATLATDFTRYSFIQSDIIIGAFTYYFIGLVISRIGSLIVEPLLKQLSILQFSDYSDFVSGSKKDEKIDLLSEVNNTYRTICALFISLLLLKLYEFINVEFSIPEEWNKTLLIVVLLIMFLFAYRKQTNYITKRIKANLEKSDEM